MASTGPNVAILTGPSGCSGQRTPTNKAAQGGHLSTARTESETKGDLPEWSFRRNIDG
jgi:hypothetical protein